ncbi:MAG: alpha/beta hydrolase [Pseudomonadota bacterium]
MTSHKLPKAFDAELHSIDTSAGEMAYYKAGNGAPLLLIHSINAAASAFEMKPLFDRFVDERTVYAVDLPGFGFSDRSDRDYSIALYTEAIKALLDQIKTEHTRAADVVALSLSCEFLARAAVESPTSLRKMVLLCPTGFMKRDVERTGPRGASREIGWVSKLLSGRLGRGAFRLLTKPATIRYFLKRTWGSDQIDEGLAEYDAISAQQPGARFAPLAFISGKLFSKDIYSLYQALTLPVLMLHGNRGDFNDYRGASWTREQSNWQVVEYDGGALIHFEHPEAIHQRIRQFFDAD